MSFSIINIDLSFNELVNFKRVGEKVLIYNDIKKQNKPSSQTVLLLQKIPATTIVSQSVLRELFPSVDIRLFNIPTTMEGNEVSKIIDDYVKETGSKEIILDLNSQQLIDYGLQIVSSRPSLYFINMRSTVPSIRGIYNNLYFGIESDDFFLPALWNRTRGPNSVRYMIVQSESNIFVDYVISSATGDITIIQENNIINFQNQLTDATTIFICSLTNASQQNITSNIPSGFSGNIVFIDSGPLDETVMTNLRNVQRIFTQSQATSLSHLPATHPWNILLKPTFSNTTPPNMLGLYTLLNSANKWEQYLINSHMVMNTTFAVNSIINQFNINPT